MTNVRKYLRLYLHLCAATGDVAVLEAALNFVKFDKRVSPNSSHPCWHTALFVAGPIWPGDGLVPGFRSDSIPCPSFSSVCCAQFTPWLGDFAPLALGLLAQSLVAMSAPPAPSPSTNPAQLTSPGGASAATVSATEATGRKAGDATGAARDGTATTVAAAGAAGVAASATVGAPGEGHEAGATVGGSPASLALAVVPAPHSDSQKSITRTPSASTQGRDLLPLGAKREEEVHGAQERASPAQERTHEEEARGAQERLFKLYSEVLGPQGWQDVEGALAEAASEAQGFWALYPCPPHSAVAARKASLDRSLLTASLLAER